MNITNLSKENVVIIFDASSMGPDDENMKGIKYIFAFNNLYKESKKLISADMMFDSKYPPRAKMESGIPFKTSNDSLFNVFNKNYKDNKSNRKNFLIVYGHLEEIFVCIKEFGIKKVLIITDDITDYKKLEDLNREIKVIPGRILLNFYDAYWWKISPVEMIDETQINASILMDDSLNELFMLNQLALKHAEDQKDKYYNLLNLCLKLYPNHISTSIFIMAINFAELKDSDNFNEINEKTHLFIRKMLFKIEGLFNSLDKKILSKGSKKQLTNDLIKFMMLREQYLNQIDKKQAHNILKNSSSKMDLLRKII